jgi:hypothetical protein
MTATLAFLLRVENPGMTSTILPLSFSKRTFILLHDSRGLARGRDEAET